MTMQLLQSAVTVHWKNEVENITKLTKNAVTVGSPMWIRHNKHGTTLIAQKWVVNCKIH